MKIFGEIEEVSLEQLASDPVANTEGRLYQNTTTKKTMVDDGVAKKALLRNDDNMVIGNDVTPANNARIHKALDEQVQIARGDDTTAEGTGATDLGQLGARIENVLAVGIPAPGNPGRLNYITDEKTLAVDDGATTRRVVPEFSNDDATAGGTIEAAIITSSLVRLTGAFTTLSTIPAGFASQRATLINRTGFDVSISDDSGATLENRILTGTGANLVLKDNSAINIYYDSTTQRWQVVGESSGAASGGGGVPSSSVVVATANYTVLITDDVILVDAELQAITLTLPSAVGNLGKRIYIEKIAGTIRNIVTVFGTVNGIVDDEIRGLNAPYEIISDGVDWKTVSPSTEEIFISRTIAQPQTVACFAPLLDWNLTDLYDNVGINTVNVQTGNQVLLRYQDAAEENGIYVIPLNAITIASSSVADEDIATIKDTSVIDVTVVSTGDKIDLRFQTDPQENGIYVVGPSDGTTIRDTSLRDPSYLTPDTLKDLTIYPDWFNHRDNASEDPVHTVGTVQGDRVFIRQTNDNLVTFADAIYSSVGEIMQIKIPSYAKTVEFEICPFGGAGAGGWTAARGGAGGSGAIPISFSKSVTPGGTIQVTFPIGAVPGSGGTSTITIGANGPVIGVSGDSPDEPGGTFALIVSGGKGGVNTGGTTISTVSLPGGPLFTNGGRYGLAGGESYYAEAGGPGSGGTQAGGGGGGGYQGRGGFGGVGSLASTFHGKPGTAFGQASYGCGAGGGGGGPANGRAGRGGFAPPGFVRLKWKS